MTFTDGYVNAVPGIHPLVALHSHRANTAPLVHRALEVLRKQAAAERSGGQLADASRTPKAHDGLLDLVAVTRGPGMRSNLSVGLDTAKGIATALDVPLVGVHHMQAHALTPRSTTATANAESLKGRQLEATSAISRESMASLEPTFPFLSLLISGGHTMLMNSTTLTDHRILAESQDIALGQYLDKAARAILRTYTTICGLPVRETRSLNHCLLYTLRCLA